MLIQILFKQKQRREAESIPPDHGLLSARAPTLVRPTTKRSPWSGRVKEAFGEASDDEKQMLIRDFICMKYFPRLSKSTTSEASNTQEKIFPIVFLSNLYFIHLAQISKKSSMRRPHVITQIRKALAQVAPTAQAIVYGSEARGDARPDSDIDLLVLVDGDRLTIEEEERIITPLYDIEIETGIQINARVILKTMWKNRPFYTPFYMNVTREGIIL